MVWQKTDSNKIQTVHKKLAKYLPDYEIKEWNEDNYNIACIPFSKEAYEVKNMLMSATMHD